jgi:hypothetical protein
MKRNSNAIAGNANDTDTRNMTASSSLSSSLVVVKVLVFCRARFLLPLLATIFAMVTFVTFSSFSHEHLRHLERQNPVWKALDGVETKKNNQEIITSIEYPVEEPIPNIEPPADGNRTFASCMLVMDDNHRLAEWIAYHYHVLPLRYMVVAIDPRSQTSPTWLLNRWRKMGVYIEVWSDKDFWQRDDLQLKPIPDNAVLQIKRDRHRGRQKFFYRSCLKYLKERNRTWVALHDSDEYLVYNHAGGEKFEAWEEKMQQRHEKSAAATVAGSQRVHPAHTPPTTAQEGAMLDYIRHEQAAGLHYFQSPCIGVPRLSFGATESTRRERRHDVPVGFDPELLDTLRWRNHAPRNDFVKNALGKVIMDVSRIDVAASPYFMSLHRPIKTICTAPWHNEWESGLRINHYLGSWESYSFRDDSRRGNERSLEQWEYKATTQSDLADDNIRPWLQGFVQTHGTRRAQKLLQDAGLPKNYRNKNDTKWTLLPDRLESILRSNVTASSDNKQIQFEDWVREKYKNGNTYGGRRAGGVRGGVYSAVARRTIRPQKNKHRKQEEPSS